MCEDVAHYIIFPVSLLIYSKSKYYFHATIFYRHLQCSFFLQENKITVILKFGI